MPTTRPNPTADPLPDRLILFDGTCGFCDHIVRAVLDADREGRFHFAPLQGTTAAALRARHAELPDDLDSVIYVERDGDGEHCYVRADAIFRVTAQLEVPALRHFARLRGLPRMVTDLGYRWVARNRQRASHRLGPCRIPAPSERARFLP